MCKCKAFLVQVILPVCLTSIGIIVHKHSLLTTIPLTNLSGSKTTSNTTFYSSVLCRGSNHTDRLCNFKNLCYEPNINSFVFFHNPKSIISGVPEDRFSPALTDFSSVSNHNTLYFNYIDLPSSSVSKFNISYMKSRTLIFKRFNPENLMHVFHDDILPAFVTLNEISEPFNQMSMKKIFFTFADETPPGPYADLYEKFLDQKPLYLKTLSNLSIHCFENAYVGLNKLPTWYQYGFKEPQGPLRKSVVPILPALLKFRSYFIKQFSLSLESDKRDVVVLTRTRNRKILNENQFVEAIRRHTSLKTKVVNLETFTVCRAIEEVIKSRILIGMHGSLLILALFLSPYSLVIELFPYAVDPSISTPYRTLAAMPGLSLVYRPWTNTVSGNSIPHPEYPPEYGGIMHLSKTERKVVENSMVAPFLCCYDPVWLYRIYQDTVVDTNSFLAILDDALEENKTLLLKLSESLQLIYPGEVENLTCTVSVKGRNVNLSISWDLPWNVNFMDTAVIEYELWLQATDTDDVQAYLTKKETFKISVDTFDKYYAWIRCHADGKVGPFNSNPLICH